MADSSNTRLDARIEAAAKAIFDEVTGYEDFWDRNKFKETWLTCAEYALAAADSAERPGVERLVAALRRAILSVHFLAGHPDAQDACQAHNCVEVKNLLAEFGQQPTGDARG